MCKFVCVNYAPGLPLPLIFATPSEDQSVGFWGGNTIRVVALLASDPTLKELANQIFEQGSTLVTLETFRAIVITEKGTWRVNSNYGNLVTVEMEPVWIPENTTRGFDFPAGYPGINRHTEEGGVLLSLMQLSWHIQSPAEFFAHFTPLQVSPPPFWERVVGFFRKLRQAVGVNNG